MFRRLKAWRRRRPASRPSAEEIAQLLLVEWLGKTDRTVLWDVCGQRRDPSLLSPVFSMYELASVYLVLGPRAEQWPLLGDALRHLTVAVQSQMSDERVVETLGKQIQDAGRRLAGLLEGAGKDKPLSWARESLREDFDIEETNPATLTMWASYWMDYYIQLSKACEDILRT
jgi:hypothetical protein